MQRITEDKFVEDINQNIGIIHKICNIYFIDADDRKDACQEILYQLWRSHPGFRGGSKFSTWMYKVALNTAITYSKKGSREVPTDMQTGNWEQLSAGNEQQHVNERMALLYAAINTLSVADKAITLLYLEDNSYDEIAEITGLTKTNVSVRLVRIKKALKEKLKNII
ncbi:RNA polymerase sigma factor [Mucilaginibacter sp.]|uniref:RNA polymerase sigma factor n=1 Tax=Mucilaginibacter sp. TaxID=1882438 RepID=UPI0025D89D22|nr:RNA polymerase sigma factor [Mucilaginibacter sp.]